MFVFCDGEVCSIMWGLKVMFHVSLQWVEVNPRQKLTLMRIASCHLIRFLLTTRLILLQVGSNIACPVSLQTKSIRKLKTDGRIPNVALHCFLPATHLIPDVGSPLTLPTKFLYEFIKLELFL